MRQKKQTLEAGLLILDDLDVDVQYFGWNLFQKAQNQLLNPYEEKGQLLLFCASPEIQMLHVADGV